MSPHVLKCLRWLAAVSLSCGVAAAMAAEPVEQLDEIVVTATQAKIRELRMAAEKAEDAFYARYNEINKNHDFDINCHVEKGRPVPAASMHWCVHREGAASRCLRGACRREELRPGRSRRLQRSDAAWGLRLHPHGGCNRSRQEEGLRAEPAADNQLGSAAAATRPGPREHRCAVRESAGEVVRQGRRAAGSACNFTVTFSAGRPSIVT